MTQKRVKDGNFTALISRALDFSGLFLASRLFAVLTLTAGLFFADVPFANSQFHSHDATSAAQKVESIWWTYNPPPLPPPPNDRFAFGTFLWSFLGVQSEWTGGATAEPGEPAHDGHPATNSVWWLWTPPDSGLAKLTTQKVYGYQTWDLWDPHYEPPGIPLYMGIYTGDSLTNLTPVTLLPGSSANVGTDSGEAREYVFEASVGQTYHIAGDNPYSCTFSLSLANMVLTQPAVRTSLPCDQPVTLEYTPLDTNTTIVWLEAFDGTNCLSIATNPPFQFQYMPSGSGSVGIWAVSTNSLGTTLVSFTNTLTFSPLNDDFANATVVTNTGESGSYFADSRFASAEPGEPNIVPGQPATHTVWWKWNPVYNVATKITLFSSSAALAIFKGTNLTSLDFVGMVQNPDLYGAGGFNFFPNYANLTFIPEAGATYYVAGEGSPDVGWSFFQQTFEIVPAETVQGFDGDTFDLQAIWHEPVGPPGPVEFVIGEWDYPLPIGAPFNPTVIGRLGSFSAPPYHVTWTPTNCGTYFLWAAFTNGFFVTNYDGFTTNLTPATRDTDKTIFQILPRNDFFINAAVIPSDTRSTNFFFNMAGASVEGPEPRHRDGPAVGTRWWTWTPSYSGTVQLKATREMQAVPLDMFTGNTIGKLSRLADNLNRTYRPGVSGVIRLPVKAGKTIFIRVDDTQPFRHYPTLPASDITLNIEPAADRPQSELYLSFFKSPLVWPSNPAPKVAARVFMPDGQTPVADGNLRAQLYIGQTATDLVAVGSAQPFYTTSLGHPAAVLGVPWPIPVVLPGIQAHTRVFAQVRVWDSDAGPTYEAAQAAGGLIGESKVIRVITGSEDAGPAPLTGIRSFKLHTP